MNGWLNSQYDFIMNNCTDEINKTEQNKITKKEEHEQYSTVSYSKNFFWIIFQILWLQKVLAAWRYNVLETFFVLLF